MKKHENACHNDELIIHIEHKFLFCFCFYFSGLQIKQCNTLTLMMIVIICNYIIAVKRKNINSEDKQEWFHGST